MHTQLDDITLALAGLFQAIALSGEMMQSGRIRDEAAFKASIFSILQTDPLNVSSVFGTASGVALGLQKLIDTFSTKTKLDYSQKQYMLSLFHLQKKITNSPKTLALLAKRVQQIKKQVDYFSLLHPVVIANLGDIYLSAITTFKMRILIFGNQRILGVKENLDKIRALLLAGVRAAILWRQAGGSQLQLFFWRSKIKNTAQNLLAEIQKATL